jgi:hypothetical protein
MRAFRCDLDSFIWVFLGIDVRKESNKQFEDLQILQQSPSFHFYYQRWCFHYMSERLGWDYNFSGVMDYTVSIFSTLRTSVDSTSIGMTRVDMTALLPRA